MPAPYSTIFQRLRAWPSAFARNKPQVTHVAFVARCVKCGTSCKPRTAVCVAAKCNRTFTPGISFFPSPLGSVSGIDDVDIFHCSRITYRRQTGLSMTGLVSLQQSPRGMARACAVQTVTHTYSNQQRCLVCYMSQVCFFVWLTAYPTNHTWNCFMLNAAADRLKVLCLES
jgi:hypothetical protein